MKFEKVSFEQFKKGMADAFGLRAADLNIKKMYDDIKCPKRATQRSAGYDFSLPGGLQLHAGHTVKIPTGIRALLDDDKVLVCTPRSGLGFKYRLQLDNTVGIVDADYSDSENEGHIFLKITNDSKEGKTLELKRGDAFAQGIILQYFLTEDDSSNEIRNGGMGSTSQWGVID